MSKFNLRVVISIMFSLVGFYIISGNNKDFEPKHFAFSVDLEFLKTSKLWLEGRGIEVVGSQGKGNQEPIVQRWMPAASVYFLDCDGNKLEFISMLYDDPDELEYASYLSEWDAEHQEK